MAKTKDIFLNIAANPTMTLEDLVSVGLTSENTVLLDRAQYASNERVQDMFKDTEGNFDEQKFNAFYDLAEQSYNILAMDEANLNLLNVTAYDSDNIFVDPSKRTAVNAPIAIKLPNPDRLNVGITRIGKIGPRTQSRDEIAQTQKVLLNPTDVAKGADPIYGDSPNDSWFTDFWDTCVMAAWDEDGTHVDPITGKEVAHKKGDLKLNENGTYYYESLDGRSVYGKQVLNKFNTLTTDGSAWNKYDFFDSDDIEQKSIGGSVLKNLALVGSMFIPYVGWGVAAASIAHQMAGLTATFGKMLAGSDSPTLSAIEGWVKSTDRRNLKTEYAQQNMWCWENFIDLIGDTTAQLREQRAIFKFAPGLIKRDFKALSEKKMEQYTKDLAKEYMENATKLSYNDLARLALKQNPKMAKEQLANLLHGAGDIFTEKAKKAARDYVSNYYKLGEPIARAYMTAITVQDTYGEAIQAGASDSEATLLTLGYAAAEAALLSTDLGKWIMPELRAERQRAKTIARKLLELPKETREMSRQVAKLDGETKKDWAKRLFNLGKDIMHAEYSTMKKTAGSILASGLGEGVEEVSEELLADFSKGCFNLVQKLQGDETRMSAFQNMKDRYAMSFVGGLMGGSINAAASDYKGYRELDGMTSEQARQELIYMIRNDKMNDFWKVVDKTTIASKELSTQLNDDGIGYKQGTREDNQDLEAKRALRKEVAMMESIINAENAKLNDSGLLSILMKADPSLKDLDPVKEYRMRALSNSATAGRFLNEWNVLSSDIIKNRLAQSKITSKYGDSSSEKYSEEDKQTLKNLGKELKTLQDRKNAMLEGGRTREFVRDALFEMSYAVKDPWDYLATEIRFAEFKTGKKYSELSEEEKKTLKEQYEQIKSSNDYAEQVHLFADIYETLATSASDAIKNSAEYYEQVRQGGYQELIALNKLVQSRFKTLMTLIGQDDASVKIQEYFNNENLSGLAQFDDSQTLKNTLQQIENNVNNEIASILVQKGGEENLTPEDVVEIEKKKKEAEVLIKDAIISSVYDKVNKACDDFIKVGFIHPETKALFVNLLSTIQTDLGSKAEAQAMGVSLNDNVDYEQRFLELAEKINTLDTLPNTPIVENLSKFQISTDTDRSVLDLVQYLIKGELESKKDITTFQLDKATVDTFKDARKLLLMYRSAIIGARNDNVDIDTIIGFNSTLNEISGPNETPQLAEIDSQTADLILEDVNTLLKRLDYAESLHVLNSGNKFNVQDKTALNKQFIFHNRIKRFISILDEDKWENSEESDELVALRKALEEADTLNRFAGDGSYESRKFTVSPDEKAKIEEESINIHTALHHFLKKHIDSSEASVAKLAKLFTYERFKGLIRPNDDFLNQDSNDIDDSAFIWWLAATAALDPHQFYNNYRSIIGTEAEGEKPIAPLATQELGVFALTAMTVNGNMFNTFGKALRQSLNNMWETATPDQKETIKKESGLGLLSSEDDKAIWKSNDFLPNFDNIIFVEGIAGSGKTEILRTWAKLMAKTNPEFIEQSVLVGHTSKDKASILGDSLPFNTFVAHDHDSLLTYMSSKYSKKEGEYILNKDIHAQNGLIKNPWGINIYKEEDVPKIIIIDEWSHYNQLEQDLMQDFAQRYGVSIFTLGDYDQLTAKAKIKRSEKEEKDGGITVTAFRNMTPRVVKQGVSMRTDNEIKNGNIYRILAWKKNPTVDIDLHYYEDERGIFGDKAYTVTGGSYGSQLEAIKLDVQKMISTLKPNEKIGYIYHQPEENEKISELYTWLTTTEGIKEHIQPYLETDAHGREAQYYIIENNQKADQDALDYLESAYTGITRSEQGSLIIIPSDHVGKGNAKYTRGVMFKRVQDSEMIPNTYTEEGTRLFSAKRKAILDRIFKDEVVTPFNITPRIAVTIDPAVSNTNAEIDDPLQRDLEQSEATTPSEDSNTSENELPAERTEEENTEENSWIGPLPKNQKLYDKFGNLVATIIAENTPDELPAYHLQKMNGSYQWVPKDVVHNDFYTKLPTGRRLFIDVNKVVFKDKVCDVTYHLSDNKNDPKWLYTIDGVDYTFEDIQDLYKKGQILSYIEVDEEPPVTVFDLEGERAAQELHDKEQQEAIPEGITTTINNDIYFKFLGFTFNNQYVADNFDKDYNIELTARDKYRIDNGYGIHKINSAYNNKEDILSILGELRRHLEYSDNSTTINYLQNKLGLSGITMRWGFISKSDSNREDIFGRYNSANAQLEYMDKEDSDIPKKHLSAIFYDKSGNPILEIPMITFQSPHSIFSQMLDIDGEIANLWKSRKKGKKGDYDAILDIRKKIQEKYSDLPGYQNLDAALGLYLFTNNGFKVLPPNWSLREVINLGNFYITKRVSETIEEHNFDGHWIELQTYDRKDRFASSILMNNLDKHIDPVSGKSVEIFRKFVPYVFISDDPSITNDSEAARRYLEQQGNPALPKTVKVVPVIPPEVTVKSYMEAMNRILHEGSRSEPYGNNFTPFRIWNAILSSPYAKTVLSKLRPEHQQFVEKYIKELNDVVATVPTNDSNLEYKKAVAKAQTKILERFEGNTSIVHKLRRLLVETCYYDQYASESTGDKDTLALIEDACIKAGITGVLCKPHFASAQKGNAIGGFAYKVSVQNDGNQKYTFPNHGSFKIFGKIDPPTYDLTPLFGEIQKWVKDARMGVDSKNPNTGEITRHENIWRFNNDEGSTYYTGTLTISYINLNDLLTKGKDLLAKLNMSEYNIDTSEIQNYTSESKAWEKILDQIHRQYLSQNGNFLFQDSTGNYYYGNIISPQTPEFENFVFDGYDFNQGKYIYRFKDLSTNTMQEVEIELDLANNAFSIIPLSFTNDSGKKTVAEIKQKAVEELQNDLLADVQDAVSEILGYFDEVNNVVNIDAIENVLINTFTGPDADLMIPLIRESLHLESLNEIQSDMCVNPIKMKFK